MQKIILGLFIVFLTLSSLNADNTKPMSNDEFMKQFLSSKKKLENSKQKAKIERENLKKEQAKTQALRKIRKALEKAKN